MPVPLLWGEVPLTRVFSQGIGIFSMPDKSKDCANYTLPSVFSGLNLEKAVDLVARVIKVL